jgi:hypothetical protein
VRDLRAGLSRSISVVMGTPSPRPPGSARHRHAVDAAVAAEDQQRVDAAAGKGAVQRVAGLEGSVAGSTSWPLSARTQPLRLTTTVTGSSTTFTSATAFFFLDQGAARVAELPWRRPRSPITCA